MTATTSKRRIQIGGERVLLELSAGLVQIMSGIYRWTPLPAGVGLDSPDTVLREAVAQAMAAAREKARKLREHELGDVQRLLAESNRIDPHDPEWSRWMDAEETRFLARSEDC